MNTQSVVSCIFQHHPHTRIRINKNHRHQKCKYHHSHLFIIHVHPDTHSRVAPLPPYWISHMNREKNAHKHNHNIIYLSISNTTFFSHEIYTQIPYLSVHFFFLVFSAPLDSVNIFWVLLVGIFLLFSQPLWLLLSCSLFSMNFC